jgi:hypothetical protein
MATAADWQSLSSSAIARRHSGDLHGAIEEMTKAISLARTIPDLGKEVSVDLNYLADMYLECNALGEAETAIHEAVELTRPCFPGLLATNLCGLAEIQIRKGERREALASAEEARHLYQQENHAYGVAQADELIGRIRPNLE